MLVMEAITRKGRQLVTLNRNKHEAKPLVERCGGDLLLRLFESEWFNSWICLQVGLFACSWKRVQSGTLVLMPAHTVLLERH